VTENEKKVKAPAKAKKNAAESAGTEAKSVAKAKTAPGEAKPRAKAANTKAATSNGPQRVPSKAKSTSATTPTHQQIAQLAHRFWKERGGHHGSHEQDWLRAERELRGKAS
jgi:hypothetical protein